jgi:hypothetical protein
MKMRNQNILFQLFALALLPLACLAADWPQFKRTADRQGCNTAEQISLPSTLCCWVDFGSPIRASAAVVGGKAYAVSGRGLLARIDLATNSVDWHAHLGGVNNESSPAVANNRVYVGSTAGKFFVLDAQSGALLKEYTAGGAIFASPLLFNNAVYFGSADGVFHALDLDGNLKWTFQAHKQIIYSAAADPATGWIVFTDGYSSVFWLTDGGAQAQVVHEYTNPDSWNMITYVSSPMIWNGRIYVGKDGAEGGNYNMIRYVQSSNTVQDSILGTSIVHGSPAADTQINFLAFPGSYDGLFSRLGGSSSWATSGWGTPGYQVPGQSYPAVNSSPAIIKDLVIFGSEADGIHFFRKDSVGTSAYRANISTGCQLWRYAPSGCKPVEAAPAVSDGRVVVGSLDGCLYGFWNGTLVSAPVTVDSNGTGISVAAVKSPGQWRLSVFPNPAGGRVTLAVEGSGRDMQVSIYDASGALVSSARALGKSLVWDLRDLRGRALPSGAYFASVVDHRGNRVRTINLQIVR